MNKRLQWIEHKRKKILLLDFSNSSIEESNKLWVDAKDEIINFKGEQPLPMLLNVENVKYNNSTQNVYRDIRNKTKNIKQKWAIYGANPATRVMIKIICVFIKDNIYFANTIDDAKDILVG